MHLSMYSPLPSLGTGRAIVGDLTANLCPTLGHLYLINTVMSSREFDLYGGV